MTLEGSRFALALPTDRLEKAMASGYPPFDAAHAVVEATRCLYCHDAPCVTACPTGIDIPEFIRRIATGNVKASARTILKSNILGLSCATVCPTQVLCEGSCVMHHQESPPIQIGRLQRYATEQVYARGIQLFQAGPPNGRRVACVGAGPASLACAHELALHGYAVTIFEGRKLPGGLNTTGVAPYKLLSERALAEVEYILAVGQIELRTGEQVDAARLARLADEHDAVFLGLGLGPDSRLRVPGEDGKGVWGAVELIERLKNEDAATLGWVRALHRATVIGGGNTAIDVVRELRRLGVPNVTLVYRRDEARMSAYAHEVAAARKEGVRFLFELLPTEVVLDAERKVAGIKVQRTRESAGGAVERVEGSDTVLPSDLVVLAIGQGKLEALVAGLEGVRLERGRILVDPATGQTGHPSFFAGGDCANGGKEVVNAAAEGKRAARGIHAMLEARAARGEAT